MKHVLLITYVFPPEPSPGAQRPGFLARYLPRFGWNVTSLTATCTQPSFPARLITTGHVGSSFERRVRDSIAERGTPDHAMLRRMLRGAKEMLLFPDRTAPWIPHALARGAAVLRNERFDAIVSTAMPASAHVIGGLLAGVSGLPWIADYRDPWAGNAYVRRGPVRKALEELCERRLIARAATITTISEPIAAQLRAFHRRSDVHVIPNAYDSAEWDALGDVSPSGFDLCYTGSMYDGQRSPEMLFTALSALREGGEAAGLAARVHFYGANSDNVVTCAHQLGVGSIVEQHGVVLRPLALRAQRESAALLIFLNMDRSTGHELGSKFLEYMGARRPILAFGPPNSALRELIEGRGLGWFASSVDEAIRNVRAAHASYRAGMYERAPDAAGLPTALDLAQRFSERLDEAVNPAAALTRAPSPLPSGGVAAR